MAVNGSEPEPPPESSGARDWRTSPTVLVGAVAVVLTLILLVFAVQQLGQSTTLWWIVVIGVAVGFGRYWRVRRLTMQAFMHVKELTKAEQYEAYRAMRRRYFTSMRETRRKRPLGRIVDEGGMHPPTLIRVANPRHYVKLQLGPIPWPRLQDVRGVTVHWTPLVQFPSQEFFDQLTEAVAHFLCVSPRALVVHHPDLYRKRITFMMR